MNSKNGHCALGVRDEEGCSVPGHCLQCLLRGIHTMLGNLLQAILEQSALGPATVTQSPTL